MNKIKLIIGGLIFIVFLSFLFWKVYPLKLWIEQSFFYKVREELCIKQDIDGDGLKDEIKFFTGYVADRENQSTGFFQIRGGSGFRFSSDHLGDSFQAAKVFDLNKDGKPEIVSEWTWSSIKCLYVYQFNGHGFKCLFWGMASLFLVEDIDQDGKAEIIEYMRTGKQDFNCFDVYVNSWNGVEYVPEQNRGIMTKMSHQKFKRKPI